MISSSSPRRGLLLCEAHCTCQGLSMVHGPAFQTQFLQLGFILSFLTAGVAHGSCILSGTARPGLTFSHLPHRKPPQLMAVGTFHHVNDMSMFDGIQCSLVFSRSFSRLFFVCFLGCFLVFCFVCSLICSRFWGLCLSFVLLFVLSFLPFSAVDPELSHPNNPT